MTPAQLTLVGPQAPAAARVSTSRRDGYLDLLRATALLQLFVVHVVSFVWYPATYPAAGILFAVNASLLAGSLDRSRHRALPVVKAAVVRLLAPLWALAAVLVPLMLALGWTSTREGEPLDPVSLLRWLLPVSPPPASDFGHETALPFWMWVFSAYLWLLVASPALLWLQRRWPKRTFAVPVVLLLLNAVGLDVITGEAGEVVIDIAILAACWMLGFAHHDGVLDRIRLRVVLPAAAAVYGLGIAAAYVFPYQDRGPLPEQTPLSYGLLSIALVLVLLRLHPYVRGSFERPGVLSGLLTAVNRRTLTIYLWGNACLTVAVLGVRAASQAPWWPGLPAFSWPALTVVVALVPLAVCVACFGWVEDKAAGRPARINPWPRSDHASGRRGRRRSDPVAADAPVSSPLVSGALVGSASAGRAPRAGASTSDVPEAGARGPGAREAGASAPRRTGEKSRRGGRHRRRRQISLALRRPRRSPPSP